MTARSLVFIAIAFFPMIGMGQPPNNDDVQARLDLLFDEPLRGTSLEQRSPSDRQNSMPSASEIRQQRALFQMQQRIQRLEAASWAGHHPLRPNATAIPMMTSRYPDRTVIYIPAYIRR
jgi:hypothetical protein